MPEMSLIVPAWIAHEGLESVAEESLLSYKDSGIELELICIDNGGHADSAHTLLEGLADVYLRLDPNQGYAVAVNVGLRLATAPVIACGGMDMVVPRDWALDFVAGSMKGSVCSVMEHRDDPQEMRLIGARGAWWGALYSFPREVLDTVGYLDDETFSGVADRDYAMRLWAAGYHFMRVPVAARHIARNHGHEQGVKLLPWYRQGFKGEMKALQAKHSATTFLDYTKRNPRP